MSLVRRRWRIVAAVVLALASAAALAVLVTAESLPSVARNPLLAFVQPGVTAWWLVLGGPFRSGPTSPSGIAFAAAANAALWWLVLWLGVTITCAVRRMFAAPPS